MGEQNTKDPEMEELFTHIQRLLVEKTSKQIQTYNKEQDVPQQQETQSTLLQDELQPSPPVYDTTEIHSIQTIDSTPPENLTTPLLQTSFVPTEETTTICDICHKKMTLGKNLSGLIVQNQFFACEHCCTTISHNDLFQWTKSKMTTPNTVRPIGLWLTQEKNKNTSIRFRK
jgi:hypothetical protein